MKKLAILTLGLALAVPATASWYWPFGDDEDAPPRLSELMENATELIDEATELADQGKTTEAVAKYREALDELANVEANNPERAATDEFISLRNKRAYVNAAIDSLLLYEARANAKAVAITDTTELEKKFLERKGVKVEASRVARRTMEEANQEKVEEVNQKKVEVKKGEEKVEEVKKPVKPKKSMEERIAAALKKDPGNRKLRLALIGERIKTEKYDAALKEIEKLLDENMSDASALNLKAMCEASKGDMKAAEKTLDSAIQSNPRDYNGYYNMANLKLQSAGNRDIARRYYETGRALGGPQDKELEAAFE